MSEYQFVEKPLLNQFCIDTPGGVKDFIIPDVVLFVNGLPLVGIECKDVNSFTSDAMSEGITQLRRYVDLWEETIAAGLKEGEQACFGQISCWFLLLGMIVSLAVLLPVRSM